MKNFALLLLLLLLSSCESTTEPIQNKKGLAILHANPVLPGYWVDFTITDTISEGHPHTYRWSIEGEVDTIVKSKTFENYFSDEGEFKITVTVFDKNLEKLGEATSKLEVRDRLKEFYIKIEKLSEMMYRYILVRPAPYQDIETNWVGYRTPGDTVTVEYGGVGKRSMKVRLLTNSRIIERSIDTTIDVGTPNNVSPPLDLFQRCSVSVSFTGDHIPHYWIADERKESLTYGVGTTNTLDTGNYSRTDLTYFRDNRWGPANPKDGDISGKDFVSWELSQDRKEVIHLKYHYLNERRGNSGFMTEYGANVFSAKLLWANQDKAIYFIDGPQLETTLDFIDVVSTAQPPSTTGLAGTVWSGSPKPYVHVTFTRLP